MQEESNQKKLIILKYALGNRINFILRNLVIIVKIGFGAIW